MKKPKLKKYLISFSKTFHHIYPTRYDEYRTDFTFIDAYSKQEAFDAFYRAHSPDYKVIAITDMSS